MARSPRSLLPLCLVVGVGVSLPGGPARADTLGLTWDAPADCPSEREVQERLARLLAEAGRAAPPDSSVRIEVSGTPGGFAARISLQLGAEAPTERSLSAPSCAELGDAATLAVALALTAHPAPAAPPVSAVVTPESPSPSPPRAAPAAPVDSPSRLRLSVRGAFGVDLTTLPAPSPGGSMGVVLDLGPALVDAAFVGFLSQTAELRAPAGAGGAVDLLAGRARGCLSPARIPLGLRPCLGFEAGVLRAAGFGVPRPGAGHGRWLAPELSLGTAWPVFPAISVGVETSALMPLTRDQFFLDGVGAVYRPPAFTARGALTVEVRAF